MINHILHIFMGGILCHPGGPFLFLHLLLRHHIILHDDPGEGSVFKNYSDRDNFDWDFITLLDTNVRDVHSGQG